MEMQYVLYAQLGTACMTGILAAIGTYLWQEKSAYRSIGNYVSLTIMYCYTGFGATRNIDFPWEAISGFCDGFFTSATMIWLSVLTIVAYSKVANNEDVSRNLRFVSNHNHKLWNLPIIAGLTIVATIWLCELLSFHKCVKVYNMQMFIVMVIHAVPIFSVLWSYLGTIRTNADKRMCFVVFVVSQILQLGLWLHHYFLFIFVLYDINEIYYDNFYSIITIVQCFSMWFLGAYLVIANRIQGNEKYCNLLSTI